MKVIKIVEYNIKEILKVSCKIAGMIFSGFSIILSFVTWEEIGNGGVNKYFVFGLIVLCSVILAFLWICILKVKFTVYKEGRKEICIRYGDIIKLGFPKKSTRKRIVVIPVNTSFDTIVDENIFGDQKPLVSTETIHGKWILNYCEKEMDINELDRKITQALQGKESLQKLKSEEARGKLKNYEIGTVVPIGIASGNVIFFLVALSKFDQNNNAYSSREEVIRCAESVLKFYYKKGQGYDLYLPLMGTGLSEAGLSPNESLRLLKAFFELHVDQVRGKVNIVISYEQKDEVSIFD